MKKTYKIALFDQKSNVGGGERYTKKLLENFSNEDHNLKIDYFGYSKTINKNKYKFLNKDINFYSLKSLELRTSGILNINKSNKLISFIQDKLKNYTRHLPSYISGNLKNEMEKKLKNYDVIFFLWPYFLECPDIKARKVIILHDLNFKYYFSGQSTFDLKKINILNKNLIKWVNNSDVIVTSNFMKKEFFKFFPNFNNKIKVIRMGSFGDLKEMKIYKKYNFLKTPYILCPSSTLGHKNNLIKAFINIKKKNDNIKLIFTGPGTEILNGNNSDNFLELTDRNNSIFGLGYVSNEEINYLIKKALVVINCSLYEPGNGSGLDAWKIGSLVAMSNIASFKEHIKYLDVRAELFDPLNPNDMAKKISKLIHINKKIRKKNIDHSKLMMKKIEWKLVIKDYIQFIRNK